GARGGRAGGAPAPRAGGEGKSTCPDPTAWSRRELRLPLTRHNYVDINALCQSHYRRGPSGLDGSRIGWKKGGEPARQRLSSWAGTPDRTAELRAFPPAFAEVNSSGTPGPRARRRRIPSRAEVNRKGRERSRPWNSRQKRSRPACGSIRRPKRRRNFTLPCSRIPRSARSAATEKRDSRFTARKRERS